MPKQIYIFKNNTESSKQAYRNLLNVIKKYDYEVMNEYSDQADLLACIGGDGTFLSFVHKCQFPTAPIIGINTGHLGFFQEASPETLEHTFTDIEAGNFQIQNIKPIQAIIKTARNEFVRLGINEVLIRGQYSHVSHFEVSIDGTRVQNFSGDGILISTPVGSTAYNYSLDGALVSPDLDVMQLTPVAPMNTNAYRCFHSSILLPSKDTIRITGTGRNTNGMMIISFDGRTHEFNHVEYAEISQSDHEIHLIRGKDYDYWKKLSNKLL